MTAPRPEINPAILPSARVRRMTTMPIDTTGAAMEKPKIHPLRKRFMLMERLGGQFYRTIQGNCTNTSRTVCSATFNFSRCNDFTTRDHCWLQPAGLGRRSPTAASVKGGLHDCQGRWDKFRARKPAEHLSSTVEKVMCSPVRTHRYTPVNPGQTGSLDNRTRPPTTE